MASLVNKILFFALGFVRIPQIHCNNICDSFLFTSPSGTVHTSGFPTVHEDYNCRRYLRFPVGGGLISLQLKRIQLYYIDDDGKNVCSMSFKAGNYSASCKSKRAKCLIFYNSRRCDGAISKLNNCEVLKIIGNEVETEVNASGQYNPNLFGSEYPLGVEIRYKYVVCPPGTNQQAKSTVSDTVFQTSVTTPKLRILSSTGSFLQLLSSTTSRSEAFHHEQEDGRTKVIVIVVCSVLIFLILIAIMIILKTRQRKRKKKLLLSQENEYQTCAPVASVNTVSAVYSNDAFNESAANSADTARYCTLNLDGPSRENLNPTYSTLRPDHIAIKATNKKIGVTQSQMTSIYSEIDLDPKTENQCRDPPENGAPYAVLNLNTDESSHSNKETQRSSIANSNELNSYSALNLIGSDVPKSNENERTREGNEEKAYCSLRRD